jgi:transcription initiation factor TFIIH subunit 2
MLQILQHFVQEYYDQNPLSHLGFVLCQDAQAEILSPLSSNSRTHQLALRSVATLAASQGPNQGGDFSLQNALSVAGRSLGHQPRHGSREIVVVTAALSTCDPGDILTETLPKLQQARIRVSCFSLSAELYVCRKIAEETAGTMGVCLDRAHFRDWMQGQCVPPPTQANSSDHQQFFGCEMIQMGFPTRTNSEIPELVHATRDKTILARTAYTCPQCQAKNSDIPADCAVCGLKLVLAPHLARSFHHLFPVAPFLESCPPVVGEEQIEQKALRVVVSSSTKLHPYHKIDFLAKISSKLLVTSRDDDLCCYTCLRPFGTTVSEARSPLDGNKSSTNGDILRFQCPDCANLFCVDCDVFLHETLHNCPGCLRK